MSQPQIKYNNDLLSISGIGPALAEKLRQLGIESISDLLFHLPLRYQDRTTVRPIRSLKNGSSAVVEGVITQNQVQFGKRRSLVCQLQDDTGNLQLRFFHFSKAQQSNLSEGTRLRCFGDVTLGARGLTMIHPEYEHASDNELSPIEEQDAALTAVYSTTAGLHQQRWRKWIKDAFNKVSVEQLPNLIDNQFLERCQLPVHDSLYNTLKVLHFPPPDIDQLALIEKRHPLQRKLALEELTAHRLAQISIKEQHQQNDACAITCDTQIENKFLASLPFELTNAQRKVLLEIKGDLQQSHAMLRLVQGDVGSGKTVVAAACALHVAHGGQQVAVLAPTEILAEQHAQTFKQWLEPMGISTQLLVSKMPAAEKRNVLAAIAEGSVSIVIGTHALIEDTVTFSDLALAIIDEQHRFGVNQRHKLKSKRHDGQNVHQLVMTATPIPRTLAMTFCADHDYSVIDELPPGRTPVKTVAIDNSRRDEVIERVRQACFDGRQIYWVCTLVEESEALQCQAAETTANELTELLPDVSIGLVHGRVKTDAKQHVMNAFKGGEIQLLVATTVIEVGVDVPNASLMIIENPERLGLSQLHQLRGRVGRGAKESHCVLMYQQPLSENGKQRIDILRRTNDGFVLSEEDLKMRGPGDVFGTRQSGALQLRMADLERDSDLISTAVAASNFVLEHTPENGNALIHRWCPDADKFSKV